MFKKFLTVSGFTALSRLTGFLRDFVMAFVLGAGMASDAFMAAFRLPNTFRSIFGEGAFNNAFVPRFARLNTAEGRDKAAEFADDIYSWQMAAQLFLLAVAFLAMRQIVLVLAPGFSDHPGQMELTVRLSQITFPYLIMTVSSVQLSAMLNAVGRFAAGAAWSILLNLTMMATLMLAGLFPSAAYAAAWGVFLGGVVQLGFIVWAAGRQALRLRVRIPRWTPQVKEFMLALGAATIGSASVPISVLVDTQLASLLPSGGLTALYYADRINQLPTGTLAIALGTVLLPEISNLLAKGEVAAANALQNRSAALGLLLTLPFVAAFFLIPDVLMAPFAHGKFDRAAAALAAQALAAYGAGIPAFVLIRSVSATFYARGDTLTPVKAVIGGAIVNIALKLILVLGFHAGVAGLAAGTAVGAWVNVASLYVLARRQKLLHLETSFLTALGPILLAAAACGAAAWGGAMLVPLPVHPSLGHDLMRLAAAGFLGALGYLAVVLPARRLLPLEALRRRR